MTYSWYNTLMKNRPFLLIIASTVLLWACAPKQPLPPLLKPTPPPEIETIDYKAKEEYKQRILDLQQDLEEAEEMLDVKRNTPL